MGRTLSATMLRQTMAFKRCSVCTKGALIVMRKYHYTSISQNIHAIRYIATWQFGSILSCYFLPILTPTSQCHNLSQNLKDTFSILLLNLVSLCSLKPRLPVPSGQKQPLVWSCTAVAHLPISQCVVCSEVLWLQRAVI